MDPYKAGLVSQIEFVDKAPVIARIVTIMKGCIENRGMELIHPASRALRTGDIVELAAATEDVSPGETVKDVHYLGFAEITKGGVVCVKDLVRMGGTALGRVVGFDEGHAPNHINIVISPALAPPDISDSFSLQTEITFTPR